MFDNQEAYRKQQINIQYSDAMRRADRLEELANRLSRRAVVEIENLSNDISKQLEGDDAILFLKKAAIIESDISKTVKNIRECASTIRRIAKQSLLIE